jgi:hypothetical protein
MSSLVSLLFVVRPLTRALGFSGGLIVVKASPRFREEGCAARPEAGHAT